MHTLCSERWRVSCFGKLFDEPFVSCTALFAQEMCKRQFIDKILQILYDKNNEMIPPSPSFSLKKGNDESIQDKE